MLLKKLRSERRRVLIVSQMVLMLDILELFLNFHFLTYIRIDENASSEQRQVRRRRPSRSGPASALCTSGAVALPIRACGTSGPGPNSLCSLSSSFSLGCAAERSRGQDRPREAARWWLYVK